MKLAWLLGSVAVLSILGGAAAVFQGQNGSSENIHVSGNVELNEVSIAFKTGGRLVERPVDEGDFVEAGMVVARLDQAHLLGEKEQAQAALAEAKAQFAETQAMLEWQRATLDAELQARRAEVRSAGALLNELSNGARPEEIKEARAALDAARADYARRQADWKRTQALHWDGTISTSQYDLVKSQLSHSEASLKQAQERMALVEAGPRAEKIQAASADVQRTEANLDLTRAKRLDLRRREHEIAVRRAQIERAEAQIGLIETQLEDTIAISPISGVVLVKSANPGEIIAPGTAVLTVGDIEHPWVRAYIREQDLGRVKLGMPARVTTDTFPGKVYQGQVVFIASDAEFTPKQIQTQEERVKLVYRVKIEVPNPDHELKSNMPADAEILVGQ